MNHEDYLHERIKLQKLQAKLHFIQVAIQAATLVVTLVLLVRK